MTNYDELIGTLRRKGADKKVWMGEETFELRCQDQTAIDAADAIVQLQARVAELEAEISARSDLMQGYLDCWRNDKARAERVEADLAAAREKCVILVVQVGQLRQLSLGLERDLSAARALLASPIGYVSKTSLENLTDPKWQELRNMPVELWTANEPPSRAVIPVYVLAGKDAP